MKQFGDEGVANCTAASAFALERRDRAGDQWEAETREACKTAPTHSGRWNFIDIGS